MTEILDAIKSRYPAETEFHQAVQEVVESVKPVLKESPNPKEWSVFVSPGWMMRAMSKSTADSWWK
jgi:hypothetical protein